MVTELLAVAGVDLELIELVNEEAGSLLFEEALDLLGEVLAILQRSEES